MNNALILRRALALVATVLLINVALPVKAGDNEPYPRILVTGEGEVHNERRLARLPKGVSYLICHPSSEGVELSRIAPAQAHQPEFERAFYGGPAGRAALERHGVRIVGMRPLRALLRADAG